MAAISGSRISDSMEHLNQGRHLGPEGRQFLRWDLLEERQTSSLGRQHMHHGEYETFVQAHVAKVSLPRIHEQF